MKTIRSNNDGNWRVIIQCKYCKQSFRIEANFSLEIFINEYNQRVRSIVLHVLEECPDCHCLHVLKK